MVKIVFKRLCCTVVIAVLLTACSKPNTQSIENSTRNVATTVENGSPQASISASPVSKDDNKSQNEQSDFEKEYQQRCYKNFVGFQSELNKLVDSKKPLKRFAASVLECTHEDNTCLFTVDKVELGSDRDNKDLSLEDIPLYTNKQKHTEQIKVPDYCLVFLNDFTQCEALDLGENLDKEKYRNVMEADGTSSAIYEFYTYGDDVLLIYSIPQP